MKKYSSLLLAWFFLPAAWAASPVSAPDANLTQGTWLLAQVGKQAQANSPVFLRFVNGQLVGNDGCNHVSGPYEAKEAGQLRFMQQSMASTLIACFPEREALSQAVHHILQETRSYAVADQRLQLFGEDKTPLAAFALQNDSLVATRWQLTGLNDGKAAVVSTADTGKMHLQFLPTTVHAIAPCGRWVAAYRFDEKTKAMTITGIKRRGKSCVRTDAGYADYRQLAQALRKASSYQRTGSSLEIRSADGALQIHANAVRP